MFRIKDRLTYANVVATIALFVTLGGTSYAAIKIDGSDVKNESLTGRDVKNGSLTGRDVKNRSIGSSDLRPNLLRRKGARGPAGPTGADGVRGPEGPRGPGTSILAHGASRVDISDSFETVATLKLPPGNWTVSASALIDNQSSQATNVECALFSVEDADQIRTVARTGGFRLDQDPNISGDVRHDSESVSMDGALVATVPTEVEFECQTGRPVPTVARHPTLTAIQTAEIIDQSFRPEE